MECGQITGWKERLSTRCPGQAQIRSLLRKAPAQSIASLWGEQGEMSPQKDAWLQPKGRDLAHKGLLWADFQLMVHGKWSMGVTKGFWEGTDTSECIHFSASFLLCWSWKDKADFKDGHIPHHYIHPQAPSTSGSAAMALQAFWQWRILVHTDTFFEHFLQTANG